MRNREYYEIQKMRIWWVWGLMGVLMLMYVYAALRQWYGSGTWGNNRSPEWLLALVLFFLLLFPVFVFVMKLETKLTAAGISFRYFPLNRRWQKIDWTEVERAWVRKYRPIAEYGGWGIRGLPGARSRAYSMSGDYGIQLVLKNGKRILVGTQNALEAEQILERLSEQVGFIPEADPDVKA
ncbi:MAG: hypothetical protein RL160_257 [Bacteroidota bacterium]|jgi:hypothetical protein